MVGRRQAAPAFRPSAPAGPANAPSRLQSIGLLAAVVVVALAISIVSFVVKPSRARSFDLFYGSVFINDNTSPVAVDLASGKPTVRLSAAFKAVSATATTDLDLIPLAGGNTLMLRSSTGEFNMVDSTGFVVKATGGGVQLPKAPKGSRTSVVPADDSAYMLQSSQFRTSIYLVGQLTVASAIGVHAKAKARAYATIKAPLTSGSSPAAAANGELWLLTDTGALVGADQQHTITQLTLPPGSNNGATLTATAHGTVTGPSALGSATINSDGTGGDVAAVASSTLVQVFGAAGTVTLPIKVDGTIDDILPASNAQGRLVFLYRTSAGWTEVIAPTSGTAPAQVHALTAIDPNATLISPADSDGHLYTMDTRGTGDLWQIEADGSAHRIVGAASYPLLPNEKVDLSQAQVFARGSRVIFNSRTNYDAEVIFSDGSHAPRAIYKHSAIQVDPSGATTLAAGKTKTHKPIKPGTKPPRVQPPSRPAQPINSNVDCKTTRQTPHIPIVQLGPVGSRSVQLTWQYPLLDPQDCAPSTYTVATKLNNPDAPAPPGTITVNNQEGVTLTGLFPDTDYTIVVTAYLNQADHTAAQPVPVHTSVEGPAAPTNLRTTVDDHGNWSIAWESCGGIRAGCVPVTNWQIIPRFCDGRGLSNAPLTVSLVGDPTLHLWHYVYQGNDGLLGRGLSFTVEGIGTHGTIGAPATDNGCAYSWTNPVRSAISVAASAPAQTDTSQAQTDITVTASFADGAVHDLGGVDGELSYQLMANGLVIAHAGPTTQPTVKLNGITAGQTYDVVVTVNPPRHPEAAVTLPSVPVEPAFAKWPGASATATFTNTSATDGTLTVTPNLGGADTRGETFDLTDNSYLKCGNSQQTLGTGSFPNVASNITPGHSVSYPGLSRFTYRGDCTVSIQLIQNSSTATNPPLYGAGPSAQTAGAPVTIPAPQVTSSRNDFAATFIESTRSSPQIAVSYHGNDNLAFATNWSFVANNGTRNCGSSTSAPTAIIDVDPACAGGTANWTVHVSYQYFLSSPDFTIDVSGTAPEPIDPTQISFAGAWTGTAQDPEVEVQYSGSYGADALKTLNWTETVTSSLAPGVTCGSNDAIPQADGTGPQVKVDLSACPPSVVGTGTTLPVAATYTLTVHYDDPSYGTSNDYSVTITGSPPQ
ncbi:MAG TPA: fibronectin type III domain-containing protein [Jatrophihabitantaceae bacterium]|nr:fibronectin type III domain-containing protein [Jatrophihabitantaceae bacterium]